jgi:hypothetical protein
MRKKITLFTIFIAALIGGYGVKHLIETPSFTEQHETTAGWIRYHSPEGKFKVDFPKEPVLEQKQLEVRRAGKTLNYQEYNSALDDQIVYSVGHTDLPGKWNWLSKKTLLKGSLEAIIQNEPGTELISEQISSYKRNTVLDFHLKKGEEEIKGRLLMVGNTLYKLAVIYPNDLPPDLQQPLFLKSFDA